jgi:hypothetical protein
VHQQGKVIHAAPTCSVCGESQEQESGYVFLWDEANMRSEWWHARCVPPDLRVFLEARGWEFPPEGTVLPGKG